MNDSHDGTRLWPASPFDLADVHRCPSCFAAIVAAVCPTCGFALTDARAPQVLALGREIVSTELARQQLIDEIRQDSPAPARIAAAAAMSTDAAAPAILTAPQPVGAGTVAPTAAVPAVPDLVAPVDTAAAAAAASVPSPSVPAGGLPPAYTKPVAREAAPGGREPVAPAPVVASAPRRRLTVPVLLLIVGVSLVGIAAVFFLILAFYVANTAVRALIVGAITLATIGLASWLRRRSLTATAEGIGALGVVLLALDAWAVRANDLFGAGATDPAVYTGIAALVVAALCRVWARVSHLRGPDLAASLGLPAGLGFLVAGLAALPPAEAATAGLLGAAAGGLVHALPVPWSSARPGADGIVERLVLALSGVGALVAAGITAVVFTGDAVAVVVWSSAGLVVLGAAHAWLARRRVAGIELPAAGVVSGVASSIAVAAAGLAGWQLALRTEAPVYTLLVGPLLAVLVAFALDLVRARRASRTLLPAAIVSGAVAAASIAGVAIWWFAQAAMAIERSWSAWTMDAFATPVVAPEGPVLALSAAVVIAAMLLRAPTMARPVLREIAPVVAAVLVLTAAARTAVPAVLVAAGVVAAVAAVAALGVRRRRGGSVAGTAMVPAVAGADGDGRVDSRGTSIGWILTGGIAVATAYLAGVATPWLWLVGVAVALAYPIAVRVVLRPAGGAAVATALVPVAIAALSALPAPAALVAATGLWGDEPSIILALLQWVALAALAAAVVLRVDAPSRAALAIAAEIIAALTLAWSAIAVAMDDASLAGPLVASLGEPALGIVRSALLLVGFAALALGATRVGREPAIIAAALTAPLAAATAYDVLRTAGGVDTDATPIVLTAAAVAVTVAAAILVTLVRREAASDGRDDAPVAGAGALGASGAPGVTGATESHGAPGSRAAAATAPVVAPIDIPASVAAVGTTSSADVTATSAVRLPAPPVAAIRRRAADLGAAVTLLVVVWGVPLQLTWAVLALIAIWFAATAVTRIAIDDALITAERGRAPHGWIAPAADPLDDRFATSRPGTPVAAAPRRLLAWPAVAAGIAAWWSWLDAGTPAAWWTIETYVIPVAVVLIVFTAVLVWLRRRAEAAVALAAGLVVGLWTLALAGWWSEPLRGVIVALVAVGITLALSFTPVRGIRPVAPVGAAVAMTGLGLVAVQRAVEGPGWQVLWLVLLVATAYASGAGAGAARPARPSSTLYALVVPPAALIAAVAVIVPIADEPRILAGSLIMLGGLHLAAAWLDRLPLTALTRWVSLGGALAIGAGAWSLGAATQIEAVSLPVAAMCLIGAVLGMLRRRASGEPWPAAEGPAWIAGLVLATAPSLLAAPTSARVWSYVILTLLAAGAVAALREPAGRPAEAVTSLPEPVDRAAAAPVGLPPVDVGAGAVPDAAGHGSPSRTTPRPGATGWFFPQASASASVPGAPATGAVTPVPAPGTAAPGAGTPAAVAGAPIVGAPPAPPRPLSPDVWSLRTPTVTLLGAAALVVGLRGLLDPGLASGTAAAIVAGVGVLAVAVVFTATARTDRPARVAAALAGAGAALLVLVTLTKPEADLGTMTVTAVIGGAVGVAGASVLGLRRWVPLGAVLAVGGLLVALTACAMRFFAVATRPDGGLEPDLWAVAGAGIAAAIAFAALRATPSAAVGRVAGAGFAVASVLFAGAEATLLGAQPTGDELRTVLVMSAMTAAAAIGFALRARLGLSLSIAAAVAGIVFGLLALTAAGVRPVELVTVPPAIGGILFGVRAMRRDPGLRSWPALGPWLALLTVPSLLHDFGESELWRIVALGVVAIAMVVVGAVYRLQAPLVLGSAVLLVHAVAQLWPWISTAYATVPWWLWLGLGGALLIFIAARYEKRMRALRTAFVAVTSLR